MTLKRRANLIKNKFKADESEYIILVGSESGTTFKYAKTLHQLLLKKGLISYITEMNNYGTFPKAKHILVFTATYGQGDAPANATKFMTLVEKNTQLNRVNFSVIGFGSHAYPDFCKYAYEVNNLLAKQSWANPLLEIHTINDHSQEEFAKWMNSWSQYTNLDIEFHPDMIKHKTLKTKTFTVVDKILATEGENAFLLRLSPKSRIGFTSGDLLSIYPANDHRERQYSIGKIEKDIQLSVKLHEGGLGSGFLHRLEIGQTIKGALVRNDDFHFPKKSSKVILISNGTGIAPFLGMINQNTKLIDCNLYCGFRSKSGFQLYEESLSKNLQENKLKQLKVGYSREGQKEYVKDLLMKDQSLITETLIQNGTIMICGSLAMQTDVVTLIENIALAKTGKEISYYQSRGQILMDCY